MAATLRVILDDKTWFDDTPLQPNLYSCGKGIKVAGGYVAFKVPAHLSENFPVYELTAITRLEKQFFTA
jgi:hypothetical protein